MCAMDTRERALIRQSGLPEIILSAKYPVCVRTESGKFIDSNSVFLHLIKCQNSDSEIWFSGIDIDTQILFHTAEVDAFSSSNGVSIINGVILNDVSWDVVVESTEVNNLNLFVWRFFERYVVSGFFIKGKEFREGANKRGNTSRLTQSFHFFMFEPIFSPVNALNQPI